MARRSMTADEVARLLALELEEISSESDFQEPSSSIESEEDINDPDEPILEADDNESESSDESSGSPTEETLAQYAISKNKKVNWSITPVGGTMGRRRTQNIVRAAPGPTRYSNRMVDTVGSALKLFLKKDFLDIICRYTNMYGADKYKSKWDNVDQQELLKFIGTLYLIGVCKSRNEEVSQMWNFTEGRGIFNKIMSRNRFQQLTRSLRFDDSANRRRQVSRQDKLQPIRELFEIWVQTLQDAYNVGPNVTVDEQLLTFRGRCHFRQYIPSKPGRYGIKLWALCDSSTSYVWNCQVYTGKQPDQIREVNQGQRVVLDMVKGLEKSGRNITCDNFFTSLELARNLLSKKLTLLGTIRRNKTELPLSFSTVKGRIPTSTLFGFQEDSMILSYCPKKGKVVTMLSTMHDQPEVETAAKKKPIAILDYNHTKGGVDTMDQMTRCYSTKRMTRRWPMALFYNILDISALNAFIVYMSLTKETTGTKYKLRRQFLIDLGKELAGVTSLPQHTNQQNPGTSTERPPKRKRCELCPRSKDSKSQKCCSRCLRTVCNEHSEIICNMCLIK